MTIMPTPLHRKQYVLVLLIGTDRPDAVHTGGGAQCRFRENIPSIGWSLMKTLVYCGTNLEERESE